MHKTDSTATNQQVHSQSSTKAISQQSKAKATTGDRDKSNKIPTSYSSTTSDPTDTNNIAHPQKPNQAHLQRLNVTASDQDHSNNAQSSNHIYSQSLHTGTYAQIQCVSIHANTIVYMWLYNSYS